MGERNPYLFIRILVIVILAIATIHAIYSQISGNNQLVEVGDKAPDFTVHTLDGKKVKLSDYVGEEAVLLNFWATYCKPCKKELPYLEKHYQAYKSKGVTVLAVNVGESERTVEQFKQELGVKLPLLLDHDNNLMKEYNVGTLPMTFLININGEITNRIPAEMTELEIDQYMRTIQPGAGD